jgi:hypothetical protein
MSFLKKFLATSIALSSITASLRAHAYAHFISYGYGSCLTCHFNAGGNGPLNDYGRALFATAIASRPSSNDVSEEALSEASGFLGSSQISDHLRAAIDFRGMLLTSSLQNSEKRKNKFIPMQSDANLVALGMEGALFASLTVGLDSRLDDKGRRKITALSREHYAAYRSEAGLSIYGGFMDVAYGLRIPEHTAFSRKANLFAQNDQNHGVFLHYGAEKWEAAFHALTGNLYQDPATRLKGVSSTGEIEIAKNMRVGLSAAYFKNNFRSRRQAALHYKSQLFHEGSGLLAELGLISETQSSVSQGLQSYVFVQPTLRLTRGFHLFVTAESFNTSGANAKYRLSPGLQYFPRQRFEFRWELQSLMQRNSPPILSSLLQLHVAL